MAKSLDQKITDYSKLTKEEKIERFLDAVEKGFWGMSGTIFWPANPPQIEVYFDDILAIDIFEKFRKDREAFKKALARVEPESLRALLYSGGGIIGLKVARKFEGYNISPAELKDFVVYVLDSIAERRRENPFCLEGKNLAWSQEEIKELVGKTSWKKVKEPQIKKAIAGLNVAAESLTWALFYDLYRSAGMAIHGPYQASKGILLARDFFDLGSPIWDLENKYPQLKVYLIYKDDVEISIDFINHPTYRTPIIDKLKFYWIATDRPIETLREIEELDNYYSRLRTKQAERIKKLKPLEIVKKGAEIHYYLLRDFFAFYNEDWRPPKKVYKRIERLGLKYWNRYRKPKTHGKSWARRTYDPRNEFIG